MKARTSSSVLILEVLSLTLEVIIKGTDVVQQYKKYWTEHVRMGSIIFFSNVFISNFFLFQIFFPRVTPGPPASIIYVQDRPCN